MGECVGHDVVAVAGGLRNNRSERSHSTTRLSKQAANPRWLPTVASRGEDLNHLAVIYLGPPLNIMQFVFIYYLPHVGFRLSLACLPFHLHPRTSKMDYLIFNMVYEGEHCCSLVPYPL